MESGTQAIWIIRPIGVKVNGFCDYATWPSCLWYYGTLEMTIKASQASEVGTWPETEATIEACTAPNGASGYWAMAATGLTRRDGT